jgi:hypothetical protein
MAPALDEADAEAITPSGGTEIRKRNAPMRRTTGSAMVFKFAVSVRAPRSTNPAASERPVPSNDASRPSHDAPVH